MHTTDFESSQSDILNIVQGETLSTVAEEIDENESEANREDGDGDEQQSRVLRECSKSSITDDEALHTSKKVLVIEAWGEKKNEAEAWSEEKNEGVASSSMLDLPTLAQADPELATDEASHNPEYGDSKYIGMTNEKLSIIEHNSSCTCTSCFDTSTVRSVETKTLPVQSELEDDASVQEQISQLVLKSDTNIKSTHSTESHNLYFTDHESTAPPFSSDAEISSSSTSTHDGHQPHFSLIVSSSSKESVVTLKVPPVTPPCSPLLYNFGSVVSAGESTALPFSRLSGISTDHDFDVANKHEE